MKLVLLDPRDNVATAADDLHIGVTASAGDITIEVRNDIPRGHKIALKSIPIGANVIRYGEIIGSATAEVAAGEHVHVHNLISNRLPGTQR
ncbi:UxaA family hydrolase [Mycolicibacterium setense]